MRHRKTENTMSLLGGALMGAAAMYLLDPELGRKRRQHIRENAGDYLETAGDALHTGWEKATDQARAVGQTIADKAGDYGQRLSDLAEDYGQRLSDHAKDVGSSLTGSAKEAGSSWGDTVDDWRSRGRKWFGRQTGKARGYASDTARDYSGKASDVRDNVTDYGNQLWKQVKGLGNKLSGRAEDAAADARSRMGEQHMSPVLPVTMTAVGCCAIGAGLMYLMDPQRGRTRRAWLTDKMTSLVRNTGKSFYRTGRDLSNRAQGVMHDTYGRYQSGGSVSSEQLLSRVRSEMGRCVSNSRLVQVMADANGTVTLSGTVRPDESDKLIAVIEALPGVNLVINRLDVRDNPGESVWGQGSSNQSVPM